MRSTRRLVFLGFLVFLCGAIASAAYAEKGGSERDAHGLRIELRADEDGQRRFVVAGLDKAALATLERKQRAGTLSEVLKAYAGEAPVEDRPAMLGEVRLAGNNLILEPRYPLEPGLVYRVVLRGEGLSASRGSPPSLNEVFTLEKRDSAPAVVEHVYPSAQVVPENLLKFYLHFSRPMSRGEAYRHVQLFDAHGDLVEDPFLELGEELWNGAGTRFTLFFDPGRIKRGLKPREEVGPVLEEGQYYTLVVSADWPDAEGRRLAREHRQSFRVAGPDDEQPNPQNWRLAAPAAGTRQPLEVRFPEPLDHAMLVRVLNVVDAAGQSIAGEIEVADNETRWRFTPARPWREGDYRLVIDTALEDMAGNSIRKPFEVDVTRPVEENVQPELTSLRFSTRRP